MNGFGFTNDPAYIQAARAWRDAAVADGWSIAPTYATEPETSASRLHRDGWTASVLTREKGEAGKYRYEVNVSAWGPDGMTVRPPKVYDWGALQVGLRTCNNCGKTDAETFRYSFAGRCCAECLPEMQRQHEKPGWTK